MTEGMRRAAGVGGHATNIDTLHVRLRQGRGFGRGPFSCTAAAHRAQRRVRSTAVRPCRAALGRLVFLSARRGGRAVAHSAGACAPAPRNALERARRRIARRAARGRGRPVDAGESTAARERDRAGASDGGHRERPEAAGPRGRPLGDVSDPARACRDSAAPRLDDRCISTRTVTCTTRSKATATRTPARSPASWRSAWRLGWCRSACARSTLISGRRRAAFGVEKFGADRWRDACRSWRVARGRSTCPSISTCSSHARAGPVASRAWGPDGARCARACFAALRGEIVGADIVEYNPAQRRPRSHGAGRGKVRQGAGRRGRSPIAESRSLRADR